MKPAKRGIDSVLRSSEVLTRRRGARAWHFVACSRTKAQARSLTRYTHRLTKWRRTYKVQWWLRWQRLPEVGKSWTRRVSYLESGNRNYAPESGFLSYFQWLAPTWYAACGCSTHPYRASWYHQATVAWRWHLSHPTGQWPNTGE